MEEKSFEQMTNDELKRLVEDFDLTVEAKNPSKPNKTELIEALDKFKAEQDSVHGKTDTSSELDSNKDKEKKVVLASKLTPQQRKRLQLGDLLRKEPVIITDNQRTQTPNKAMFVAWGNGLIGHKQDVINLEGRHVQYVRRGALKNLRTATITVPFQENIEDEVEYITTPRFTIIETSGMSQEELRKKKIEQQIKSANAV